MEEIRRKETTGETKVMHMYWKERKIWGQTKTTVTIFKPILTVEKQNT